MAVNVKMGVDLGGFTSGIKEGQQILKGLNAEMKATEAEFAATGNAEQLLANKTKTLNSQLQVQKGIADQAAQALKAMESAGIAPTDAAYQKMYATMMNATAGMNQAQAELNALSSSANEAATGANSLKDGLEGIGKKISLDQVITGVHNIAGALEKGAKFAVKIGKEIMTQTLGAASWADELKTTAEAYGISTDELQRMEKTAQIIDTSVDDILKARQKLGKNGGAVEELFGIETEGRSIEDVFWETGEAIMAMGDAFEQEEAAQKIFGKSWRDLVPLFTAGREEYERVNSTWKTVSDEQLDSLQKLDDQYQSLKADMETLKMETLSELAEPVAAILEKFNEFLSSDDGKKLVGDTIGAIRDGLFWISENSGTVVAGIEAIAVAWGLLKVSEDVLTVIKVIEGLKGLTGLGSAAAKAGAAAGASFGAAFVNAFVAAAPVLATLLGVTAVSVAGAVAIQKAVEQEWIQQQNEFNEAAQTASAENRDFILKAAEATGPKHNADGTYQRNLLGFLNANPDSSAAELLMMLQSRQDQQRAELFGAISQYAQYTNGSYTTDLLLDFWANPNSEKFDAATIDEMLTNITRALSEASKPKVDVELQVPADEAAQLASQVGTVVIPAVLDMVEDGSHANGLWSVPYDGYLARLHKGERVVPAREVSSRSYNSNLYVESMYMNNGMDANGLASAMAAAQRRTMSGYGS